MKKITLTLLIILALYAGYLSTLGESSLPPLNDGDLIFQTSLTDQSIAIALSSLSLYIHTGVIHKSGNATSVVEAALHVTETPLHTWINRGVLQRFSVYRYKGLTPVQGAHIVTAAQEYIGRPYDFYFSFDNDAIYCSELDYLAFRDSGISLVTPEKIGDLYVNNRFVKKIIEQRWHNYPACQGKNLTFDQCYDQIMAGQIVTPATIAHALNMELIFSNYP
jgi:hypothetical protein